MPIYEYLCPACNRIYSFLARSYDAEHDPTCPRCGARNLRRQVSRFAVVRAGGRGAPAGAPDAGPPEDGGTDPLDDPRMERELMRLVQDAEHMDEHDPRQMGRFMRRMSEVTGEKLDAEMEEAVRRLEAGEDVERVDEDMGGVLGGEEGDPFDDPYGSYGPSHDEGLYPM